jgi:hypothetical protein
LKSKIRGESRLISFNSFIEPKGSHPVNAGQVRIEDDFLSSDRVDQVLDLNGLNGELHLRNASEWVLSEAANCSLRILERLPRAYSSRFSAASARSGSCLGEPTAFGIGEAEEELPLFLEGVGNVFKKDEPEADVFVFRGVHVAAHLVCGSPKLSFETESSAVFRIRIGCGF